MGEDPNQQGNSRRWIIRAVEDSLRRLGTDWIDLYQVHRIDPRTDIDETLGGAQRPRAPRQGPLHRPLHLPRQPDRRGAVGRARPAPAALRHRAAAVLDPRPRRRGRRPAHLRALRHGGHVLQPADRRLAVGPLAQGRRAAVLLAGQPAARALRPLQSRQPAQAGCRRGTRAARRRGGHHAHPARDRVRAQPPRHHRRAHRAAHDGAARKPARCRDVVLDEAILDRIDEIVAPGTTLNPADNSFTNPALEPAMRRRDRAR